MYAAKKANWMSAQPDVPPTFLQKPTNSKTSPDKLTAAHLRADLSSTCILPPARTIPACLTGNVALREILAFENISNSRAYELGLVPMYAKNGAPIENNTIPPFPWLCLPPPIVKTGKKLWDAGDVMNWHYRIRARALSTDSSTSSDDLMQCEVPYGH